MKPVNYLLFLFLILDGCIEPFHVKIPASQQAMVVDGMISDQPGPYTVLLYRALPLDNEFHYPDWVSGASITMYDDQGGSETLKESTPGHYETSVFQGVVGRSYHIRIVTGEGKIYESTPEKMEPVGDYSNLHYEFIQPHDPSADRALIAPRNGFNVFLDADVLPEQAGLVRWRWTGTFEIRTYPELRVKVQMPAGPVPHFIPDPPLCSGYIVPRGSINMQQNGPCTCCYCWVNQYNDGPLISDTRFINNGKITGYNVAFIPASRRFFYDKYYLEVEQLSVSQTVYDFWKKIETQSKKGSDLFQTPPSVTSGNVRLISEDGLAVIGIFAASAIKKHSFIIPRSEVPYTLPGIDTIATSCLEVYTHSSSSKPDFW